MFNGYWRIILAIVGVALLAGASAVTYQLYDASEQQQADYDYQPAGQPRLDKPTKGQPIPKGYQPYCQNPDEREDADLCAQWAAVEQVAEANRLSSFNLRFAIFTLCATIIGTALLLWTLIETRVNSRRELRSYLFVSGAEIGIGTTDLNAGRTCSWVEVKNSGSTPAREVAHWHEIAFGSLNEQDAMRAPSVFQNKHRTTVPPSGTITASRLIPDVINDEQIVRIKIGEAAIFIYGAIEYIDVFNRRRRTDYRLFFTGQWPPPEKPILSFCESGNDFT